MIYAVGVQGCPKGEASKFKPNKNGVWPVILKSVTGASLPQNSDILDGSVAASMGVEIGKTHMMMITEKDPYVHTDGKVYKKYDYVLVGGDASQQVATEMAKSVMEDIAKLIARPSKQASPSTSASPSPSPSTLTQPVVNADESAEDKDGELSDEELAAQIKALQLQAKARKEAAKKAAEKAAQSAAAPPADLPF